ncbi:aspartate/glutamate racemase family protein [Commensalibacter oyaizuii]|uniref:Aspartate/glutamate racemase family protein n=1 Tax=Commensalibacter oyaizuii TaxID=3043873 RepID=A0ABT6Q349_9PROT|nr:aspartate/glutamate racemase family protein [Commensalibacter sp. TBRC 16381]MDI2091552.1 aspartate/glutamate racemase family protein [Commensalibacter sp. TBRC 16381]
MDLLIINPNTTVSMTKKIDEAAKKVASLNTKITAVNPSDGPVSIEGYFDEVFAVPGMIGEMQKHPNADAYIIACFDDTGLDAARCVSNAPVIGIGEAAFHIASLVAGTFTVVTTLSRSIPAIKHNLGKYGLLTRCAGIRASEVPVLDLEKNGSDAYQKISDEIGRALLDDRAEAIVLGCAGMADLAASLSAKHHIPVIDGVSAAVKLSEAIVQLGIGTSKWGGYRRPVAKEFKGIFAPFSPK